MDNDTNRENARDVKKVKKRMIIFFVVAIVALAMMLALTEIFADNGSGSGGNEVITVDPEKLCETKEEGFDIFEYEEYLNFDRNIYFDDGRSGVIVSIDDSIYKQYGEGFALVYDLINAIINGDSDLYNQLVAEDVGHYDSFTQQQLYGIMITRQSEEIVSDGDLTYNEYVFVVEYKIHENNGSFRRDIESDASRPQYIVIDDSSGELIVTNIVYVKYAG